MARRAHLRGGRRVLAAPVVAVVDPESAGRFFFYFQNFGAGLLAGTGLETAAGAGLGAGVGSATAVFGSARSAVATANSRTGDDRSAGTGGAADARSGITTAGGFDDVGTDSGFGVGVALSFASGAVVDFGPIKSKRSRSFAFAPSTAPSSASENVFPVVITPPLAKRPRIVSASDSALGRDLRRVGERAADESGADCYGCFCKKG